MASRPRAYDRQSCHPNDLLAKDPGWAKLVQDYFKATSKGQPSTTIICAVQKSGSNWLKATVMGVSCEYLLKYNE